MRSLRSSVKRRRVRSEVARVPPIPAEVIHILNVGMTPRQDLSVLIAAVRRSSVVSRAVIREANALSTCAADNQTTVVGAITDLGRTRVVVVALGSAVVGVLDRLLDVYGKGRHQMWQHSVITAHVAELVVHLVGPSSASEADLDTGDLTFELPIAALLHDVGTVVLAGQMKESWIQQLRSRLNAFGRVGGAVSEIDHAEVGSDVVEHWGLSATVAEAIRFHHSPADCSTNLAYGILIANEVADKLMHSESSAYSADAQRGAEFLGLKLCRLENGARQRMAELGIQIQRESDLVLTDPE